tara:strand:- start:369 stop:593 length:225 start_codon:yes stop_codon:yes gene_type:complete
MKILINKRKNVNIAILIFITIFVLIQYIKPSFLYTNDGAIRNFGIGYKENTIVPMWLITIIIAILSYYLVIVFM